MKKSATGVSSSHSPREPTNASLPDAPGTLGRQFRRQQAAVGVAHYEGPVQAQLVQQFLVEQHQVPQVVQVFQPAGLGHAGVGRER